MSVNKEHLLRQIQDLGNIMGVVLAWKDGKYPAGVAMEQIYYILIEEDDK